jgi:hypothetical protein
VRPQSVMESPMMTILLFGSKNMMSPPVTL